MEKIFLDTDIGPDCDDTAALAMLLEYCAQDRAKLLGATHCTSSPYGLAAIDAIARRFGMTLPLGTWPGADFLCDGPALCYTPAIAARFVHGYPAGQDQPDALDVFRSALLQAEDGSVTLIAIGPMNNLARYLREAGELMRQKIRRILCMAGCFEAEPAFAEWNVEMDIPAARQVVGLWQGELDFCPWEALGHVLTGACLKEQPDNPVAVAYDLHTKGEMLRPSWDPGTVAMALYDVPGLAWSERGRIEIDEKGISRFFPDEGGRHRYIRKTGTNEEVARALEADLARAVRRMSHER